MEYLEQAGSGQHDQFACTSIEFHDVDGDGRAAAPAIVLVGETPTAAASPLAIVGGQFAHAAAREQAVRIAKRQSDHALRLAVFEIGTDLAAPEPRHVSELDAAFNAVLIVAREQRGEVVSRLVQTILRLDGQDQWISCDRHDVRHVVGTSGGTVVRFGCGHGAGSERAACAARDAIGQAERQGAGLHAARGVCVGIRAASKEIAGREIKDVIRMVQCHVSPGATITISIGCDSALADGGFEVDIFAFGQFDEGELSNSAGGAAPALDADASAETASQGADVLGDPLYAAARSVVLRHQRASISLVQRTLRIGYGHACRLLERMEGDIVSAEGKDGKRTLLPLR